MLHVLCVLGVLCHALQHAGLHGTLDIHSIKQTASTVRTHCTGQVHLHTTATLITLSQSHAHQQSPLILTLQMQPHLHAAKLEPCAWRMGCFDVGAQCCTAHTVASHIQRKPSSVQPTQHLAQSNPPAPKGGPTAAALTASAEGHM